MYYPMIFVMTSSLRDSQVSCTVFKDRSCLRLLVQQVQSLNFRFVVPLMLIAFTNVIAPETPHEMASICERHNPEIVCQVW